MNKLISASFALALAAPAGAMAQESPEIKALRQQIEAMRAAYEARLKALEQRLGVAEAAAVQPAAEATPAMPATAANVGPAATSRGPSGSHAFNPAISLILSGTYARTSQDPASYAITGVQLPAGGEFGPGTRGFSLGESELTLSASIDPWLRGQMSVALDGGNAASVEEAFIQTTALSYGLTLKAGRFLSGVGYLNSKHAHTWDFVDNPLAYQAFLGTQLRNDGIRLSWLAPTDHYIELGAEVGRGQGFPGSDTSRNNAGLTALTAHTGGDIGTSHNWRAGVSALSARANDLGLSAMDATGATVTNNFSGRTRVWIVDGVWKWAPGGNASRTSFTLQGEYLRSSARGGLVYDIAAANSPGDYRAMQSGWYLQGIYKFLPAWRVGLRTEKLNAGTPDFGANAGSFASTGFRPLKNTVMLEYNPSEFSRIRLQLANDRSREGFNDRQLFLQYQMSLGAHGAHGY